MTSEMNRGFRACCSICSCGSGVGRRRRVSSSLVERARLWCGWKRLRTTNMVNGLSREEDVN